MQDFSANFAHFLRKIWLKIGETHQTKKFLAWWVTHIPLYAKFVFLFLNHICTTERPRRQNKTNCLISTFAKKSFRFRQNDEMRNIRTSFQITRTKKGWAFHRHSKSNATPITYVISLTYYMLHITNYMSLTYNMLHILPISIWKS